MRRKALVEDDADEAYHNECQAGGVGADVEVNSQRRGFWVRGAGRARGAVGEGEEGLGKQDGEGEGEEDGVPAEDGGFVAAEWGGAEGRGWAMGVGRDGCGGVWQCLRDWMPPVSTSFTHQMMSTCGDEDGGGLGRGLWDAGSTKIK